jgi:hypothetical protein
MAITMALGVALLETVYSEFNVPTQGFTAAFCVAGISCSAAAILLSRKGASVPVRPERASPPGSG